METFEKFHDRKKKTVEKKISIKLFQSILLLPFYKHGLVMAPVKANKKNAGSSNNAEKDVKTAKKKKDSGNDKKLYIVRPLPSKYLEMNEKFATVYVSKNTFEELEINKGSFVKIINGLNEIVLLIDYIEEDNNDKVKIDDDIVLINQYYLNIYGILFGERVLIEMFNGNLKYVEEMNIEVVKNYKNEEEGEIIKEIIDIGIVYKGLNNNKWYIKDINEGILDKIQNLKISEGEERVEDEEHLNERKGFIVHPTNSKINLIFKDKIPEKFKKSKFSDIGGCNEPILKILNYIKLSFEFNKEFKDFGIVPPKGLIIYGPSGVGKSMILNSLVYEIDTLVHVIKIDVSGLMSKYLGDSEEKLRKLFKEAEKYQPSIIIIDDIDTLLPNNSGNNEEVSDIDNRIINSFNKLIEEIEGKIIVVSATNDINKVDIKLRRPGKLDIEIEIGIPDVKSRLEIFKKILSKVDKKYLNITEEEIYEISSKTHGYVGSDIFSLIRETIIKFILKNNHDSDSGHGSGSGSGNGYKICMADFEDSMKEIRPSAMKEIVLEMPKVKWEDIGGQEELKSKIFEMVELPLREVNKFNKLGIKVPKGLLLYGPPGCSKTMTAKALATESGLNFFAIKGPEIFNKYVGESERSIRQIFSKARSASPSIVFIDEIDAISSNRESDSDSNVSKQVLNTLLNELDGVEEMNGVITIGATNRPWTIDAALLRPGRLDRHVFVAPPDFEARKAIVAHAIRNFCMKETELAEVVSTVVAHTEGISGAQLVQIVQEAGVSAVAHGRDFVIADDFCGAEEDEGKGKEEIAARIAAALEKKLAGEKLDVSAFERWEKNKRL